MRDSCLKAWVQWTSSRDERGDVPGWVLVTVMSAGLVGALTPLVRNELSAMLTQALDQVR